MPYRSPGATREKMRVNLVLNAEETRHAIFDFLKKKDLLPSEVEMEDVVIKGSSITNITCVEFTHEVLKSTNT